MVLDHDGNKVVISRAGIRICGVVPHLCLKKSVTENNGAALRSHSFQAKLSSLLLLSKGYLAESLNPSGLPMNPPTKHVSR